MNVVTDKGLISPFPKSAPPASTLIVCDIESLSSSEQLLMVSLQGLVNRKNPCLYLCFNHSEYLWPERLKRRQIVQIIEETKDWRSILTRFRSEIRGLVITDPDSPATVNIATMLAGIEDALIISPELLPQFDSSWTILSDLRGKWQNKVDAYQWAYANLWPQLRHDIVAIRYPNDVRGRDYLIQFRIFTFWISGAVDGQQPGSSQEAETSFAENIFTELPANCPIMGYPYAGEGIGPGEGGGVALATGYGKYIVCDCPNLSVHSGAPAPVFKQPELQPITLDPNKVYLTFIISDGDNLNCWDSAHLPLWQCGERGQIPLGWNVMPGCYDLIPDMLAYYYETASENDYFVACGGGIGYANPYRYANRVSQPEQVRAAYLAQTAYYLQQLDLNILNPYHLGYGIDHQNVAEFLPLAEGFPEAQRILKHYAESIPGLVGFLPDYARTPGITYPISCYLIQTADRQVPVAHAMTEHFWPSKGKDGDITARVDEIRNLTDGIRPAFIHAFTVNWCFDPNDIAEVLRQLGPDFIAIRPDQFLDLGRQHWQPSHWGKS